MKVYILGKNKDDKGSQLEKLTYKILEEQGYSNIVPNMQVSGASELDLSAIKYDHTGIIDVPIPVLCECKAHNNYITMSDWLKFIGKLYIERKKPNCSSTIGLMIALSGANGAVQGSYKDDFSQDPLTQLITNNDLYKLIAKIYKLNDIQAIKEQLYSNYNIQCSDIDIVYYEHCYILVSLGDGEYTLCDNNGELLRKENVENILDMLNDWTDLNSASYVDIWERESINQLLNLIEGLIIAELFDSGNSKISVSNQNFIDNSTQKPIDKAKLCEAVNRSQYLKFADNNDGICLIPIIDNVEFIKYNFSIGLSPKLFACDRFQLMISQELLESISKIQYGITLNEEESNNCLFLIKHSPSALLYALTADNMLHSYSVISQNASMKDLFHNHFFRNLTQCFERDFSNQNYNSVMLNSFGISDFQLTSKITIVQNRTQINLDYQQFLSLVNIDKCPNPALIVKVSDEN